MSKARRILGQVLTAVSLTPAAGGIASFFRSKVELRFIGDILTSDRSRIVRIIVNPVVAVVGVAMLRSARKPGRP